MGATVLETCEVSPPPGSGELWLPLTFMDIPWIHVHPIRRVIFYGHPCSKSRFLDSVVPNLKHSLSLTLKHYLPFSGNLVCPNTSDKKMPAFRYLPGDSVSFTVAESTLDFDHLAGNHARDADQFYHLIPEIPPVAAEPGCQTVPVMALRVTLFPGRGVCISHAFQHCLVDGSSILRFMSAWASHAKRGDDFDFEFDPPVFDRSLIRDPVVGIDSIFWKVIGQTPLQSSSFPLPTNRVRATFTLGRADIDRLKDAVRTEKPGLKRLSAFVVVLSYVWVCLVKSGDDGPDLVKFAVDVRPRVDPPLPENYIGNCLSFVAVRLERSQLAAAEGFGIAAEAVAEGIEERVKNKDQLFRGVENWLSELEKMSAIRALGVAGSPKFDLAAADFGWGPAKKVEVVSMDGESYSMSLCKSGDCSGGFEVGMLDCPCLRRGWKLSVLSLLRG